MQSSYSNSVKPGKYRLLLCLWIACSTAHAAVYKCTSEDGNTSYQSKPCNGAAIETTIQEPKAPPTPLTRAKVYVSPAPRSMLESSRKHKVDTGPLETWNRFANAWNSGNRDATMKELTPEMQQRHGDTYDKLH